MTAGGAVIWWWLVACGGEIETPDWVADCDCAAGEICVWGGVAECLAPPEACGTAFDGTCDLGQIGDPCTAAICGFALTDTGGIGGSTSIAAECWSPDDAPAERWFDCDAPLTF